MPPLPTERERIQAKAAWSILESVGGLLDRTGIMHRYSITRSRVHELTNSRHFPEPVGYIGRSPVWLTVDVDHFRNTPTPRGRPRKTTEVA